MITVKLLKEILNKLPEDAIVAYGKECYDSISDLSRIALNDITFKDKNDEVMTKKVALFEFEDLASCLADKLIEERNNSNYVCSPSVFIKKVEENTNSITEINDLDFYLANNPRHRECRDMSLRDVSVLSGISMEHNKTKTNNIDKIFKNVLILKLKNNLDDLKKTYQETINQDMRFSSLRNKIRMLLYKE